MAKTDTGEPAKTSGKKPDVEDDGKIAKKLQHARDIDRTQARRKIKVVKKVVKKKVKKKEGALEKKARDIGIDVVPVPPSASHTGGSDN